jgi:hypothetical protein
MAARAHVPLTYDGAASAAPPLESHAFRGAGAAPAADGRVRDLAEFAIIPEAGDNCAIARAVTPAGTLARHSPSAAPFALSHTVLEGHRFAIRALEPRARLLSWGLTFGEALVPVAPGDYLANERVLAHLRARGVPFALPAAANFADLIVPHTVDESTYAPAPQGPRRPGADAASFQGFARADARRGVGTRNYVILVGTTSATAGYVKALEARIQADGLLAQSAPPFSATVDGVVAVPHTEGSGDRAARLRPNNFDLLVRTRLSVVSRRFLSTCRSRVCIA